MEPVNRIVRCLACRLPFLRLGALRGAGIKLRPELLSAHFFPVMALNSNRAAEHSAENDPPAKRPRKEEPRAITPPPTLAEGNTQGPLTQPTYHGEPTSQYRYAVICSSNMNRSVEAHVTLKNEKFNVGSFGCGRCAGQPLPPRPARLEKLPHDLGIPRHPCLRLRSWHLRLTRNSASILFAARSDCPDTLVHAPSTLARPTSPWRKRCGRRTRGTIPETTY